MMSIEDRSHRELQAYGAASLAKYCAAKGIRSSPVEELVEHLLLLLTSTDLPEWETAGCALELPGRGDPLPASLEQQLLPAGNLAEFDDLVEAVVEVGLVDMYGPETDEPFMYALRARSILDVPAWFLPGDRRLLFRRFLSEGDLGAAWLTLNSKGWLFADAKVAIAELARAASDPAFSLLAEAWSAVTTDRTGGY